MRGKRHPTPTIQGPPEKSQPSEAGGRAKMPGRESKKKRSIRSKLGAENGGECAFLDEGTGTSRVWARTETVPAWGPLPLR